MGPRASQLMEDDSGILRVVGAFYSTRLILAAWRSTTPFCWLLVQRLPGTCNRQPGFHRMGSGKASAETFASAAQVTGRDLNGIHLAMDYLTHNTKAVDMGFWVLLAPADEPRARPCWTVVMSATNGGGGGEQRRMVRSTASNDHLQIGEIECPIGLGCGASETIYLYLLHNASLRTLTRMRGLLRFCEALTRRRWMPRTRRSLSLEAVHSCCCSLSEGELGTERVQVEKLCRRRHG